MESCLHQNFHFSLFLSFFPRGSSSSSSIVLSAIAIVQLAQHGIRDVQENVGCFNTLYVAAAEVVVVVSTWRCRLHNQPLIGLAKVGKRRREEKLFHFQINIRIQKQLLFIFRLFPCGGGSVCSTFSESWKKNWFTQVVVDRQLLFCFERTWERVLEPTR